MTAARDDIQYLVLPDAANPHFLARVRWPDVCQAVSPVRPDWQDDPGLFDLPYDPDSTPVTFDQAAAIAAAWDARLPADETVATPALCFMRRMPANWSDLSRAERRAWSIEDMPAREPVAAGRLRLRLRLPRRRVRWSGLSPAFVAVDLAAAEAIADDVVIDLTDAAHDAPAGVDGL